MSKEEFQQWLIDEVDSGRMNYDQMQDLLTQKALFERDQRSLEESARGLVVGFVAGVQLRAGTLRELLHQAYSQFPRRMIYFEPIGFSLL